MQHLSVLTTEFVSISDVSVFAESLTAVLLQKGLLPFARCSL